MHAMMAADETPAQRASSCPGVPWTLWVSVLAVTCATVGGQWDLAWHRSIGRDSFWTPAHVTVYACGVLIAIVCVAELWRFNVGAARMAETATVRVLGMRAPLGVFVAGWGGLTMLTSAAFDNWWHNAYGLDVRIISPPHIVLLMGMRAVSLGVLFLLLAALHRAAEQGDGSEATLRRMYVYLGGVTVASQMYFLEGYTLDFLLHTATAYRMVAVAVPVLLVLLMETSGVRWSATASAAIYMGFTVAEVLIFPLFPAQPRLGPVYYPVAHLVPTKFPLLLMVPAVAMDVAWPRVRGWGVTRAAVVLGAIFLVVLVAVEWPFASFLLSRASENRFFGTGYFAYNSRPDGLNRLREFAGDAQGLTLVRAWVEALVAAMVSSALGLGVGRWMKGLKR